MFLYYSLLEKCTQIFFTVLETAVIDIMVIAGFRERIGEEHFYWDAVAAIKALEVREYGSDYAD